MQQPKKIRSVNLVLALGVALWAAVGTTSQVAAQAATANTYPVKASSNGRYLVASDGTYFRYRADTVWLAPAKLKQTSIKTLLDTRKSQGFNTIQMSVLMFNHLGDVANAYGDKPFKGTDISAPVVAGGKTTDAASSEYDYWDHVDWIVKQAAARNMQINLVASWYGYNGEDWRPYITNAKATAYGKFLAKRLGANKNIMWTLGGDNAPGDKLTATRNMAAAIQANESVRHLMSYHSKRRNSSELYFAKDSWDTMAFAYSDERTHFYVQQDYNRLPAKPVIMPESWYDARNTIGRDPVLNVQRLRAQAYWTYLSGGVGFAYGHERIWDVNADWKEALNATSAKDMQRLTGFFNAYKFELVPDHRTGNTKKLLASGYGSSEGRSYATSARSTNGKTGLAYFPSSRTNITVNLGVFNGGTVKLSWFNPANGTTAAIGSYAGSGNKALSYPAGFSDAVLVAKKN